MSSSPSNQEVNRRLEQWRQFSRGFLKVAKSQHIRQRDIDACLSYSKNLILQGLPPIMDAQHFSSVVGLRAQYVMGFCYSDDQKRYYRDFALKKSSGGVRQIYEPLPNLKRAQYWILNNILDCIDTHPSAHAFKKNHSIKTNARFHAGQKYQLNLDVKDFFPSISAGRVFGLFSSLGYAPWVARLLSEICTLENGLPQGAPTSPALSNIIMRPVDARLLGFARKEGFRYTRYADDMTFSGGSNPKRAIKFVENVLKQNGLIINEKKTRILKPGQRQMVTGIISNNKKLRAPRAVRREIKKALYFIEKHGLESHLAFIEDTRANTIAHYIGLCDFVLFIDPEDQKIRDYRSRFIQIENTRATKDS